MATIWRIEGFEHGSASSVSALRVPDSISATSPQVAEIVTSPARTGARALRLSTSAGAAQWSYIPAAGVRIATVAVYIRFATLPTADVQLLHFNPSATPNLYLWFMNTNDKFGVSVTTSGQVEGGPVIVANQWYRVTVECDLSTTTDTIRAIVDGTTEFSDTAAGTARDIANIRLGNTSGATFEAFYDDLLISITDGDYEDISTWPGHSIEALIPSADGSHNITTLGDFDSFATNDFSNATTNGYTFIAHRPLQLANTADGVIRQELGTVANYMEFTLENLSAGSATPQAARAYGSHVQAASGAALAEAQLLLSDNTEVLTEGNLSVINSTEDPSTTVTLRKRMAIAPSGGWDRTKVDGLKARVGFGDNNPDVNFIDFMVEVLLKQGGAASVTPATVAGTTTIPTPTVSAGTANVNITPTTLARIASIQIPTVTATAAGGASVTLTTVIGTSTVPVPLVSVPGAFPTRTQALARPNQVVLSGTRTTQYKVQTPPDDTTYDFRGLYDTAFPFGSAYPLLLGASSYSVTTPGARTVVVGGTVVGQQARDLSWSTVHDVYGGGGLIMCGSEYFVSYDYRCDNVGDGFRAYKPTQDPNARYLLEGAYMNWVRDDAVESDNEMSGTIRDCCVESTFGVLSLCQSTTDPNAVHNIEDCIFIMREMLDPAHAPPPDYYGHGALFKNMPAGEVNMTNVKVGWETNPNNPDKINYRPAGTWTNVTYYLGPNWVGADPVIDGVTISHDWAALFAAVDTWKSTHGIGGEVSLTPVVGTATVPTPTVSIGAQSAFINTPEVIASHSIPTPSVVALSAGGVSVTPNEVGRVASVLTPIVSVGGAVFITPTTVVGTSSIPIPVIFIGGGTAVTPATVIGTAIALSPSISVGPLSVGEFSYNSLVFGGNREIGILNITGLEPPDTKVDIRPKVGKDGSFVTAAFYQERYVIIDGDIAPASGDPAALEALVDTWRVAFDTQPTDLNLDYQLPNAAATLRIKCRPIRRTIIVDREYSTGLASWSVEFLATDPAIYSTGDVKVYDG